MYRWLLEFEVCFEFMWECDCGYLMVFFCFIESVFVVMLYVMYVLGFIFFIVFWFLFGGVF